MATPAKCGAELTARERNICDLFMSGLSGKEVAAKLERSPKTITTHKERIFTKTGTVNDVQLGRWLERYATGGAQ